MERESEIKEPSKLCDVVHLLLVYTFVELQATNVMFFRVLDNSGISTVT